MKGQGQSFAAQMALFVFSINDKQENAAMIIIIGTYASRIGAIHNATCCFVAVLRIVAFVLLPV
jgi:hypothetical protein